MSAKTPPPTRARDDSFQRFMMAILRAYHDEGLRDGPRLSAYANQLISGEPRPKMPLDTLPADFARAMVDKVDKTPGINPAISLGWLMEALGAWNDCAEAYMWISNIIEGREHATLLMQPFYVLAIEALRRRLGPLAPGLGSSNDERRMMAKAQIGLGESLATAGLAGEAASRYVEALRWEPGDSEGARPRLAISLALQDELESAATALGQGRPNVFAGYAAAVIAYARTEGSAEARPVLAEAHAMNPDVADILSGRRKMKGMLTGNARFDEAQYACLMLGPVVSGMPGFAAWVRRETAPPPGKKHRR